MSGGWAESAAAWIADMGEQGDFGRQYVLDRPMLARAGDGRFATALDVGCGEGRFCRMLATRGVKATGIDPTRALITHAKRRDPTGTYRIGRAEALEFPDGAFDLAVCYLSLIDIPDLGAAIAEMTRVLRPGGSLLIANLTSFSTAGQAIGWMRDAEGKPRFGIDGYLDERVDWVSWRGIRIRNWHRPLGTYMALLLEAGLELRHFSEPEPYGGEPDRVDRYRRAPWFLMMEWQKPGPA